LIREDIPATRSAAKSSRRRRAGLIGAVSLIALLVVLIALRSLVLFQLVNGLVDCRLCISATTMQQDVAVLALLLAFTGLSLLSGRYWLQLPWLISSCVLVLAFAVDVALQKALIQRLYWSDLLKFGSEFSAIGKFSGVFIGTTAGKISLVVAVVVVTAVVLGLLPRPKQRRVARWFLLLAVVLGLFSHWEPLTIRYVFSAALKNFISVNLDLTADKPQTPDFVAALLRRYQPETPVCSAGQSRHANIIVLVVESLSLYHSQLFGGINDFTPNLDKLARYHTYFPDFIANGFSTDGGLIALITGRAPIPEVGRYEKKDLFGPFNDPVGALPDLLHPYGYSAHFFTTGDLNFLDKPTWLKALHFDSWEGADAPFYNGWKRHHFNAAEDKALYLRFAQWLDQRKEQAPYLAVLLTVSTHPPFINPENDQPDEAGVFRYADRQIEAFYEELQQRGFFHDGVLIVSGDHRSMTPLTAAELVRFDDSALARTPFVVVSDFSLARGAVAERFQQTDLPSSIADLVGSRSCLTSETGSFLRMPPQPAQFSAHARGDQRDGVDIYFGKEQAQIILDGDQTHWEGPRPPDWQHIMDGILLDRIQRGTTDKNLAEQIRQLRSKENFHPPAAAGTH
jgi:lipoteichoic acid synthase